MVNAKRGGPNPVDVEVGARVRARRRALRLSQSQLADALGITFQQVQKYERGANRVSASMLVAIAQVLRTSVAELVGETASAATHDEASNELMATFQGLSSTEDRQTIMAVARAFRSADMAKPAA